ncbi:class I SAM-dependent methyltransferase [Methylomonas sp. SURF-2]|uniref:Class I SAM-dependent methyltransferase n=1 Tax=Methylomonas subterranea TaxID=2952225 RepID=A0ABT1TBY9_9GAMM|nr:class I SAM-dependent methyltransferase [Methylomonas sp. SURF-2]MCQ8102973.1 class I SAM-dependent methyltransferase [Methylomonas sp. SURF-2]
MLEKYRDYKLKDFKKLLVRKLKLPLYLGSQHDCPTCGAHLKKFKPMWKSFPRKLKEHGFVYPLEQFETLNWDAFLCPSCDCSDRERLYALYIRDWLAKPAKNRVIIDFAPSLAISSWLRTEKSISYKSADLYRPNVDDKVDITDMPKYEDNSVDAFICSHVLEHITNDRAAMKELYRILKPDGFGIVMVPLIVGVDETNEDSSVDSDALRWKYFAQCDHVRLYGKADFINRLRDVGFNVEILDKNYFGVDKFHRYGIGDNAVLYVVRKSAAL